MWVFMRYHLQTTSTARAAPDVALGRLIQHGPALSKVKKEALATLTSPTEHRRYCDIRCFALWLLLIANLNIVTFLSP